MIEFKKTSKYIQLVYIYGEYNNSLEDWVINNLRDNNEIGISNNTFTLTTRHLVDQSRLSSSKSEYIDQMFFLM